MNLFKFCGSMTTILISGAVACGLTLWIGGKLLSRRRRQKAPAVECVFFSPKDIHLAKMSSCMRRGCPTCNYKKLCGLLRTARNKLDLCMYLITEPEVTNLILKLHKKGVYVRIIADKQMNDEAYRGKTIIFIKNRIPMKCLDAKGMMHNKFVIIDNKVVVTGSCNWTQQGLLYNYENIVIVRDERTSKQFLRYFNDLWSHKKII